MSADGINYGSVVRVRGAEGEFFVMATWFKYGRGWRARVARRGGESRLARREDLTLVRQSSCWRDPAEPHTFNPTRRNVCKHCGFLEVAPIHHGG